MQDKLFKVLLILSAIVIPVIGGGIISVSYTHLDVYKRQGLVRQEKKRNYRYPSDNIIIN